MSEIGWTLWVFAGPGALSDVIRGEGADTSIDEAALWRELGLALGHPLPASVTIVAELVGEPTLLQTLTGEWPSARFVLDSSGVTMGGSSERDLQKFVDWAQRSTPGGSRRGLSVLGDWLRATGDESRRPFGLAAGGDRPTYPNTITVKKKSDGAVIQYTFSGCTTFDAFYTTTNYYNNYYSNIKRNFGTDTSSYTYTESADRTTCP